jgi:hypothetical protein
MFLSFLPAISKPALKRISAEAGLLRSRLSGG